MTTRKHAFYGILALVSLLGLGITQSTKANLITNPGFETGDFTGWTVFVGIVSVGPEFPHSGSFATSPFPTSEVGQTLATTPGAIYHVSFFLAQPVGSGGTLDVLWGGSTVFSYIFNSPSGYTELTFNVTASSASTALGSISAVRAFSSSTTSA
jgi:hypothetical protein